MHRQITELKLLKNIARLRNCPEVTRVSKGQQFPTNIVQSGQKSSKMSSQVVKNLKEVVKKLSKSCQY